jgi:protein SCO1/2
LKLAQGTVAAFGVWMLVLSAACSNRAAKLPVYDSVPAFQMIDSNGQAFDSAALGGKVWVADFIYTNCPAECPMMSAKMHRIEKRLRGENDVRLVSISVDPARDTPAALTTFAKRYGGPTDHWIFLTGTPETVHKIAYTTFHVGDVLGKIEHSTKFVLVDKDGRIRGYYSSLGQDDLAALVADAEALRRASS